MTNAELAILSLIVEQPRHGYQIEQTIEERDMRQWTEIGFSSIYYLLNKLEKQGLAESRLEAAEGRGPARKVFYVTEAGRVAWLEATLAGLAQPPQPQSPFLLSLSNLPALPPDEVSTALKAYHSRLADRRDVLRVKAQVPDLPPHVTAMFDYSLSMLDAEYAWLDRFIADYDKRRPA